MKKHDLSFLADLIFPPRCPFCGQLIRHGEQTCKDCRAIQPTIQIKELFCQGEIVVPCYTAFLYHGKVRDSMLRFKFEDEPSIGTFFGRELAILIDGLHLPFDFDVITAVPMTRWHQARRGYNQSERLAKTAATDLKLPYKRLLRKRRHSRVQHLLTAEERFSNVLGAYAACSAAAGKKILLIDDIVTTGATLTACVEELLQAGAAQVVCAAATQARLVTDKD